MDGARPAHVGAVLAARPRIRDMIRDATNAELVVAPPLLLRLVENATAAFLKPFDDSERTTAHLNLQEAAQAADEAWEQIVNEHNGPSIAGPTIADVERVDRTLKTKMVKKSPMPLLEEDH